MIRHRVNRRCLSNFSRRTLLRAAAVAPLANAALAAAAASQAAADLVLPPGLPDLRRRYEALAREWILNDRLARLDGYVYTVEWGHFLIYFALTGDRDLYLRMRDHVLRHLLINDADDALTQGFILWRYKPGEPRHASGTTEMLRVAKGLWHGARTFSRPEDADLALLIVRGYGRHAAVDQDIWLVRNYFSFTQRVFATNSFLVDYDPDFVAELAAARDDAELRGLSARCYGVYRKAVSPSGLIYDLLQPEIKTLVGRHDVLFFSPNDIMGLHNSTTCAQVVAKGLPHIAKGVLGFALARIADLRAYYFGRTGEAVDDIPAGLIELNGLLRLAMLCGGAIVRQQLLQRVLPLWQEYEQRAKPTEAYNVSEVLLTLQAVMERKT